MKMKVGILGAGGIAQKMALTLAGMDTAEAYAVGAREGSRAEAFAKEYHISKAYGSYEALLANPDVQDSITLTYKDGRMATLLGTVVGVSDRSGRILGDNGYAIVDNINNSECIRIFDRDHNLVETINRPEQITGFEYEVQAAVDAIHAGLLECPQMTHAQTIQMMERMDAMRHSWGFYYPGEPRT